MDARACALKSATPVLGSTAIKCHLLSRSIFFHQHRGSSLDKCRKAALYLHLLTATSDAQAFLVSRCCMLL